MTTKTKREPWWALVEENRKLVWWTINRFFPSIRRLSTEDQEDYVSEGYKILIRVAKTYRTEKGSFSTVAVVSLQRHFYLLFHQRMAQKRGGGTVLTLNLGDHYGPEGDYSDDKATVFSRTDHRAVSGVDAADWVRELIRRIKFNPLTEKCLRLYYWEGLTFAEIAAQLGMGKIKVRGRVQTAMKQLRDRIYLIP